MHNKSNRARLQICAGGSHVIYIYVYAIAKRITRIITINILFEMILLFCRVQFKIIDKADTKNFWTAALGAGKLN